MLFKETVSPELLKLLKELQAIPQLNDFRLVGGTSLALQLGHRKSIDIDLFADRSIDKDSLPRLLYTNFPDLEIIKNTSFGFLTTIHNIKVDFCHDGGKFIRPIKTEAGIKMAALEDISAMKLGAILNRAVKKDFYDIAILLDRFSIKDMLGFYREKYPFVDARQALESFKKSYKADEEAADKEKGLVTLNQLTWEQAKEKINKALTAYLDELKNSREKEIQLRLSKAEKMLKKKKR